MNCRECRWADVSDGERTIKTGDVTVTQKGSNNIVCKCPYGVRTIDLFKDECSAFEKRKPIIKD